jgi:thiamine-phosphate pyrophosphorylase
VNLRDALRLYLVTDPDLCGPGGLVSTCEAALRAGVKFLQLRDKASSTGDLVRTASELLKLAQAHQCCFVVNDRVDVALAVGAHGVHLGADDMPVPLARKILGADPVIGVSVRTPEEALTAWKEGANYLAANIVFATPTKPDSRSPLGLSGVERLARATPLPLVAIGGISRKNAGAVIRAGADGVAVVSAIMAAPNPAEAVRTLLEELG